MKFVRFICGILRDCFAAFTVCMGIAYILMAIVMIRLDEPITAKDALLTHIFFLALVIIFLVLFIAMLKLVKRLDISIAKGELGISMYLDEKKEFKKLSSEYQELWTKNKKLLNEAGKILGCTDVEIEIAKQVRLIVVKYRDLENKNKNPNLSNKERSKNNLEMKKLDDACGEIHKRYDELFRHIGDKMEELLKQQQNNY